MNATSSSVTNPVKPSYNSKNNNNTSGGFLMKLLPHRRRQNEEVKRASSELDDYANLLGRDSIFLSSGLGDNATVSSATASITEFNDSMHSSVVSQRPSVVAVTTVGSFERQEISLGKLLGKGRFSKVYEITSIELNVNGAMDTPDNVVHHLDATEAARTAMSENAREGKYSMKRLRKKLLRRPKEFTRAAAHMVLEAQYLSKLDHPNILKLRGSALGGASSLESGAHDGYFLILDRVNETLQERIHDRWALQRASGRLDESALLYRKAYYALQLASALEYLHDRRIIFRDLSPKNMGFTEDHSLQLYDFGMARELPQALGFPNELFHMTQNAGTRPYTAVEVATKGLYNLKADVYSWSMVTYEVMMEQVPMAHVAGKGKKPFATKEFIQAVYIDGERPTFDQSRVPAPPRKIQELLESCWQKDLFARPNMENVCNELRAILKTLPNALEGSENLVNSEKSRFERPNLKDMTGFSMTIEI